jgi:purine nucleoside permease
LKLFFPLILAMLALEAKTPFKPRVVVAVTFERGADMGDEPGELQYWVEREKLTVSIPFSTEFPHVRMNREGTILGVITGMGAPNAASAIMALALDKRFDLSESYWLINGIAGVDPEDASIGSAAWARYVIDADLVQEIDAREIPADWKYGRIVALSKRPNQMPASPIDHAAWQLNSKLVEWAFSMTRDVVLMDTPQMAAARAKYTGNAARPPFVLIGDSIGSSTWWQGRLMNAWANDWAKLWTGGKANAVMTNREDNGLAVALCRLADMKRANFERVLFLRTASDYAAQAPNETAVESLLAPMVGILPAFEACWRVGSPVVRFLAKGGTPPVF